jgi:hypothetical protein
MHERRAFPRSKVQIDGKVVAPDMPCVIACMIQNLSEDGALVATDEPARVPRRAYLWQARTGTLFECDVRWRKGGRLFGLRFVDTASRASRRALIDLIARDARPRLRVVSLQARTDVSHSGVR